MKEHHEPVYSHPVKENPFWLRAEARIQKYGALLLMLIVLAALGGLFSEGYLSDATARNHNGQIAATYQRFGRLQSDTSMRVSVKVPQQERVVITLGGDFMQGYEIRTLQPQPSAMSSQNGALRLEYNNVYPGTTFTLWLGLTPLAPGSMTSQIDVDGLPGITLWQFIYP
ncbi:hypothetical protein KXR87_21250 [Yokenella regensburgei]|uniref:hypothetical protein n=1 Tax=Yokenella regensburgei TaxID=158877 RepID=UPI003F177DAA